MVPPIAGVLRSGSLATLAIALMVRVMGRINGQLEPTQMLMVDTIGDPISARRALVDEAAAKLQVAPRVSIDNVTIYLDGGVPITIGYLEKDDVIYFGFNGEPWRAPEPASKQRIASPPPTSIGEDEEEADAPDSATHNTQHVALPLPGWTDAPEQGGASGIGSEPLSASPEAAQSMPTATACTVTEQQFRTDFFLKLDALPIKKTLDIEISNAFDWDVWHTAHPTSDDMTLDIQFLDATLQRSAELEWRTRCTSKPVALAQTIKLKNGDLKPIKDLFDAGWFRPYTPRSQVRIPSPVEVLASLLLPALSPYLPQVAPMKASPFASDASGSGKKAPRKVPRSREEMEADWMARAANPEYKLVRALGVEDDLAEPSETDVKCIPCQRILSMNSRFQLQQFDEHCGTKTHTDNVPKWERWSELVASSSFGTLFRFVASDAPEGQKTIYCLACSFECTKRIPTALWDLTAFASHCYREGHTALCLDANIAPIPAVILEINKPKPSGIEMAFQGGSRTASPVTPAAVSVVRAPSPAVASSSSTSVAVSGNRFVAVTGTRSCQGVLRSEQLSAFAATRTGIKTAAREASAGGKKKKLSGGKERITEAHDVIEAKSFAWAVYHEGDEFVARSLECTLQNSDSAVCRACLSLSKAEITDAATTARVASAKVDCFEALISSAPMPEHALTVLRTQKLKVTVLGQAAKRDTNQAEQLLEKSAAAQMASLVGFLAGYKAQSTLLQLPFLKRLELLTVRKEKFQLLEKVNEIGTLSPVIKHAIAKMSADGVQGAEVEKIMQLYVTGDLQTRHQAAYGMLLGAAEKSRRDATGSSMGGAQLKPAVFNLLLALGPHGKKVVKTVSLNLLGYEVELSNLRRKVPQILNLPKGAKLEIINPDDNELARTVGLLLNAFQLGTLKVVNVHVDPTKVAGALQYCAQRGNILGPDTANAKIGVPDQAKLDDFIATLTDIVPADQANVFAMSPQVCGYSAFEVAVEPERHSRKGLSPEQLAKLAPATTASSVFKQSDRLLTVLEDQGAVCASYGCDGGVHGSEVVDSLHRTTGEKLAIVGTRTEISLEGMLLDKCSVKLP